MSNMHGYSDYDGPVQDEEDGKIKADKKLQQIESSKEDSEEEDAGPLQAGFWMEGDSLAPPCGTAIPTIIKLLEFAGVTDQDVLYDFGCGDGRVCLEAYSKCDCVSVGVEVEADLVARSEYLISTMRVKNGRQTRPRVFQGDLREVLTHLVDSINAGRGDFCSEDHHSLPLPTIIVLYLLPESLQELTPRFVDLLLQLPPTFRILCNTWGLPSLNAVKTGEIIEPTGSTTKVFLYDKTSLGSSS